MKALLRKDAIALMAFAVGGLMFHLVMQGSQDGPWINPEDRYTELAMAFLWFASTLLGLAMATLDDLARTREYLQHRSVSPALVFWIRHLGGALVIAVWVSLTPALHLVASLLFRADAHLVDAGRYWYFVDETSPALVFYALGVFSGTLVRRLWLALPVAAVLSTFFAVVYMTRVKHGVGWLMDFPIWVLAVPLALAILRAAAINEREGRDADVPWQRGRLLTSGVLVLIMTVSGFSFLAGTSQESAREMLLDNYPGVGRLKDGTRVLYRRALTGRRLFQVDGAHRPVAGATVPIQPLLSAERAVDPHRPLSFHVVPERVRPFHGRHLVPWICGPGRIACFITSAGLVEIVKHAPSEDDIRDYGQPSIRVLGREGDGQPFPLDAMPIGHWWGGRAFVGDPKSGALWSADLAAAEPRFVPMALPGGDRFRSDLTWSIHETLPRDPAARSKVLILRGDHGVYVVDELAKVQSAPPVVAAAAAELLTPASPDLVITKQGPLTFHLNLAASAQGNAIDHGYRPHTLIENLLAGMFHVTGMVRPAGFALVSRAVNAQRSGGPSLKWIVDPYARGMPVWITLISLALSLALAGLTWRRLARAGAGGDRLIFWAIAVGLGGLPAYVCARAIESRRVWLPLPDNEAKSAKVILLIQAA